MDENLCDDFGFSSEFRKEEEDERQSEDPVDFETDLPPLEADANDEFNVEMEDNENEKKEDGLADVASDTKAKRKTGPQKGLLNVDKLVGKDGIPEILNVFDGLKFRGRGHEVEDLNMMMAKLEQWAHRLCPKMPFDEVLERIEVLGSKRPVQTALARLRHGDSAQENEETVSVDEVEGGGNFIHSASNVETVDDLDPFDRYLARPQESQKIDLTSDQRRRIEENKRKAQERRLAKESQAILDDADFDALLGNLGPDFENTQPKKQVPLSQASVTKNSIKPIQYVDDADFMDEEICVEEEDEWFTMDN